MGDQGRIDAARTAFERMYGERKQLHLATAPGRINIIGEHTDYNHGFVFPCGLDRHMYLVFSPRTDSVIRVYALDLKEEGVIDLPSVDTNDKSKIPRFIQYMLAPALKLSSQYNTAGGRVCGFDAVLTSTIPNGGGVSSSSALAVASGLAFQACNPWAQGLNKTKFLYAICESEWEWSGVRGGIMDQYTSLNAVEGHAFVLDCRSSDLEPRYAAVAIPPSLALIVANTNVKHDLVGTPYNDRRSTCERVAAKAAKHFPDRNITHLRDVKLPDLVTLRQQGIVDTNEYKRALHVIQEEARTLECAEALRKGELELAGWLVNQSHADLSLNYDVSCLELDLMVDIARACPGVLGARMMGGGFGGCAIVLCKREQADAAVQKLSVEYQRATNIEPHILIARPGAGAQISNLSAGGDQQEDTTTTTGTTGSGQKRPTAGDSEEVPSGKRAKK